MQILQPLVAKLYQKPRIISHLFTSDGRTGVGAVTRWTDASVSRIGVLANGVPSARALQRGAFVDI